MVKTLKKWGGFFVIFLLALFFLGKDLNPFNGRMFSFHDDTQAGRVQEFAFDLAHFQIPPRLAPHFSFNMGFPVFNFYAPFAYWVTSLIHLVGINPAIAVKISFLSAVLCAFLFMYLFLTSSFSFFASIVGSAIYSSCLWVASEIFVRGNLGELWFIALLPLAFFLLKKNAEGKKSSLFVGTVIALSFLFTVHNIFSLLAVPLVILFSLLYKNKKKNILAIGIALLLSAYFLVPAVVESPFTYASQQAKLTNYSDHFLCAWQLWYAPYWGYGGSAKGCIDDGMAFKLGKVHIVLAIVGVVCFLISLLFKRKDPDTKQHVFMLLLGAFSFFLTLYQSQFIWKLFEPILSLFQFPWRFLLFVVFFAAYFSSVSVHYLSKIVSNRYIQGVIICILVVITFKSSSLYFQKPQDMTVGQYASEYLSPFYLHSKIAYLIPEYFPKTGNFNYWMKYSQLPESAYIDQLAAVPTKKQNKLIVIKNDPYEKIVRTTLADTIIPSIHYFPFWTIQIDGKNMVPTHFDKLGRPLLPAKQNQTISIRYNETPIEKLADWITVVTLVGLFLLVINKKIWNKLTNIIT